MSSQPPGGSEHTMYEHPIAKADRELRYVRSDLAAMRSLATSSASEAEREEAEYHLAWLTAQETADVLTLERARAEHCRHVWVPAGLDPRDRRVCARCNAEQEPTLQG